MIGSGYVMVYSLILLFAYFALCGFWICVSSGAYLIGIFCLPISFIINL